MRARKNSSTVPRTVSIETVTSGIVSRKNFSSALRYHNAVASKINVGVWTYEEDKQVWMEGQLTEKPCWSKLSRRLGTRSDNQLLTRYKALKKSKFPLDTEEVSVFQNIHVKIDYSTCCLLVFLEIEF